MHGQNHIKDNRVLGSKEAFWLLEAVTNRNCHETLRLVLIFPSLWRLFIWRHRVICYVGFYYFGNTHPIFTAFTRRVKCKQPQTDIRPSYWFCVRNMLRSQYMYRFQSTQQISVGKFGIEMSYHWLFWK